MLRLGALRTQLEQLERDTETGRGSRMFVNIFDETRLPILREQIRLLESRTTAAIAEFGRAEEKKQPSPGAAKSGETVQHVEALVKRSELESQPIEMVRYIYIIFWGSFFF